MGIFDKLRAMLGIDDPNDDWPSIVHLLRDPVLPDVDQALEMARGAWGAAGPVKLLGQVGPHSFALRVDPLNFAIHAVGSRYGSNAPGLSVVQQQAWDHHTAWLAVDLPGRRIESLKAEGQLAGAFKTLMHFVFKHWSANCLALYFPAHGITVPNQGDLIESIRWARRNEISLDFLKETKPSP